MVPIFDNHTHAAHVTPICLSIFLLLLLSLVGVKKILSLLAIFFQGSKNQMEGNFHLVSAAKCIFLRRRACSPTGLQRGRASSFSPDVFFASRDGYGSKLNHQELGRRFWSMFPLTRVTHLGYPFLTDSQMSVEDSLWALRVPTGPTCYVFPRAGVCWVPAGHH